MSTTQCAAPGELECWFDFGSNYSYLALMRIDAMAARHGVRIACKPFLLGPIFESLGWNSSPFVLQEQKGAYTWRDMARQAEKYGLPWTQPTTFPRRALLPTRIAVAGAGQPWIGAFCQRIMQRNFVDDRDIDDAGAVAGVLLSLGLPAAALIEAAQSEAAKEALRAQTAQAARRGIFGAPTFFAGDEMFWGNDRLDDALAYAADKKVKP